jgi:hypothetical protein
MTQSSPQKSLAQEMAATVADLYMLAGTHILAPHPTLQTASQGDPVKLGMCIAATVIQQAMCRYEEGSAAFGNHLHQPTLDDVQRK